MVTGVEGVIDLGVVDVVVLHLAEADGVVVG
jgi:hypothetical protein